MKARLGMLCVVLCLVGCVSTTKKKAPTLTKGITSQREMQGLIEAAVIGKELTAAEEILKDEGFEGFAADAEAGKSSTASYQRKDPFGFWGTNHWNTKLVLNEERRVRAVSVTSGEAGK